VFCALLQKFWLKIPCHPSQFSTATRDYRLTVLGGELSGGFFLFFVLFFFFFFWKKKKKRKKKNKPKRKRKKKKKAI